MDTTDRSFAPSVSQADICCCNSGIICNPAPQNYQTNLICQVEIALSGGHRAPAEGKAAPKPRRPISSVSMYADNRPMPSRILVGTCSWTDKTLIDSGWYPPDAKKPEERLRFYSEQFPVVE